MILLDSNIIIYSYYPENQPLREYILKNTCSVSVISIVETLGYHKISKSEQKYLEEFFLILNKLPVNQFVIYKAVELRQIRKMTLGYSLIASTAIIFNQRLATKNLSDFDKLHIECFNPFDIL